MTSLRLTPEQAKKKADAEAAILKKRAQLKRDFNEVFATPEGKNVLRALCEMSGFLKSDIVADAEGTIHLKSSLYNMAFRNFYLKIRANVNPEILRDVELATQEGVSAEVDIFS